MPGFAPLAFHETQEKNQEEANMSTRTLKCITVASLVAALAIPIGLAAQEQQQATASLPATTIQPDGGTNVPRLIKFSGEVNPQIAQNKDNESGKSQTATQISLTFSLYELQEGGSPLWTETQSVQLDSQEHYTVLLGANSPDGLPLDLFASGQARWLGVQPQLAGAGEQPRVLLVGVPYALKAADADTLGGKPASAYALSPDQATSSSGPATSGNLAGAPQSGPQLHSGQQAQASKANQNTSPTSSVGGTGTLDYIPIWTGSQTLGNSILFQTGGQVGVGTITPGARLDSTSAGIAVRGTSVGASGDGLVGTATASSGSSNGVFGQTASPGGNGVLGVNNAKSGGTGVSGSGTTNGVYGQSASPTGIGVSGGAIATSGSATGVYGQSASPSGNGVSGNAIATSGGATGVYGQSASPSGSGVHGIATATSGSPSGVYGESASPGGWGVLGINNATSTTGGSGVFGISTSTSGSHSGVYGQINSTSGAGVNGNATATSGVNNGVYGQAASPTGFGVSGNAIATSGYAAGVYGQSASPGGSGVSGNATATSGSPNGVYGKSVSPGGNGVFGVNNAGTGGNGVFGIATAASGHSNGVYGQAASTSGIGVSGNATATTGNAYGVAGSTATTGSGAGVAGSAVATTGTAFGVFGQTASSNGRGVFGYASATSGAHVGVVGFVESPSAAAGQFVAHSGSGLILQGLSGSSKTQVFSVDASGNGTYAGNLNVTGKLTKGSGSFKIDHPLDPANKYLSHSFVESPDMMDVYNGVVRLDAKGRAWVGLPDYFEALNRDFRYQLTCIGGFAPVYIAREVHNNRFRIAGGKPGGKVSWEVTGIRHDAYADANRIPVTEDKPPAEQGYYLHPEVYGQDASRRVGSGELASQSRATASAPSTANGTPR
jgi:trimeric autotransporter adhesin